MELQTIMPISFTESAITELKRLSAEAVTESDGNSYLRVGVKGGGCSGFTYILDYDKPGESDLIAEIGGIQVIMDKRHELYLAGIQIDFEYGLNARGFVFNNPNAKETCGCGTSFSAN